MHTVDLIRAWKDAEYRASLSDAERAALPAHPAGLVELPDEDLATVAGGRSSSLFNGTCGHICRILTPKYDCRVTS